MKRIAVAVSGGVDSLYALLRLYEQGHDVLAVYGRFLPAPVAHDPVASLIHICAQRSIPFHIVDLQEVFAQHVIAPFVQSYAQGCTPNPCAQCNVHIKFGALFDVALGLGAHALATGHYARLCEHDVYGRVLAQAADSVKDQSYFLSLVPAKRLARVLFPMADVHKKDVIAYLSDNNIAIPLPQESQDICFVPRNDYASFLESTYAQYNIALGGKGNICLKNQPNTPIGEHKGLWRYTEGQRKGLGIAWQYPLYVLKKDNKNNILYVGGKEDVYLRHCRVASINFLVPQHMWPEEVHVRLRYRQKNTPAHISWHTDTQGCMQAHLALQYPCPLTAPGQLATIYDTAGHILGGGVIMDSTMV